MALKSETKYPSRRTYVLKVRGDATPESIAGRIENVVTGRQCDFRSDRELVDLLAGELAEGPAGRPPADADRKP